MGAKPSAIRIAQFALAQRWVVSTLQLRELGLSRRRIGRWVSVGLLHPLHRGVYAFGRPDVGVEGWRVAALLVSGPEAVLSHRTAAELWELRTFNSRWIDVTVPPATRRDRRSGIRLHRAPLPAAEITRHDRFPVTTVARTLFDLAADVTPRVLERMLDEAERRELLDEEDLAGVLDRNRRRPGRPALLRTLAKHRPGSTLSRSGLEEALLAICREHRLPGPRMNVPIGPYVADFVWQEARLIVETDEETGHRTRLAIEHDKKRDAYLSVRGYRVVRYTERRIHTEPGAIGRELRALTAVAA